MYKQPGRWGKGQVYLAHQTWKRMSNPICINHHSPRNIQALKHATLPVRGQQCFNALARDIRNMTGCKVDMCSRDGSINICPPSQTNHMQVLGYTAQRRADSNSVLHMAKFVNAHWPSQVEVFGAGDSPSRRGCAYSVARVRWCPKILQMYKVTRLGCSYLLSANAYYFDNVVATY